MSRWCICHAFPSTAVGGADEHIGEDEAGAGFHQAASLLHTAVAAGEGRSPHQHETGAQETAGGDTGDEVSVIISCLPHKDRPLFHLSRCVSGKEAKLELSFPAAGCNFLLYLFFAIKRQTFAQYYSYLSRVSV